MFKTEVYYGVIAINGYETKIYSIIKTGSHIDFKLKYYKTVNLHNTPRKGGQSANRFHRIGIQKKESYINETSEKTINIFQKR